MITAMMRLQKDDKISYGFRYGERLCDKLLRSENADDVQFISRAIPSLSRNRTCVLGRLKGADWVSPSEIERWSAVDQHAVPESQTTIDAGSTVCSIAIESIVNKSGFTGQYSIHGPCPPLKVETGTGQSKF